MKRESSGSIGANKERERERDEKERDGETEFGKTEGERLHRLLRQIDLSFS